MKSDGAACRTVCLLYASPMSPTRQRKHFWDSEGCVGPPVVEDVASPLSPPLRREGIAHKKRVTGGLSRHWQVFAASPGREGEDAPSAMRRSPDRKSSRVAFW